MNWKTAQRLMTTARDKKKGKPIGNNTRLYDSSSNFFNTYEIRLHGNVIMQIYKNRIELSDGGWRTVTTKARLNTHLPQGFYVFQKNWEWFIQDMNVINPDDIETPMIYPFGDVYYIHNDNRVMLYSTHPKYPSIYDKEVNEE